MRSKIKYWPYLFFMMISGMMLISCEMENEHGAAEQAGPSAENYGIPFKEGKHRYHKYLKYDQELEELFNVASPLAAATEKDSLKALRKILKKVSAIKNKKIGNIGAKYFHLPPYKIDELIDVLETSLTDTLGQQTYALLSLRGEGANQDIDLMFYVGNSSSQINGTEPPGSFYDFTDPCPPTCEPPPPGIHED